MRQPRNTSRNGVKHRRRAYDVVARRSLTNCYPASCSYFVYMPTLDHATLKGWLHHWQDEFDAAYLYLVLAGQENDSKKKEIYIKLAGVEERHTQMWEKLLAEHGHPIPQTGVRPSLN